jgi:hypothetical protein
LLGCHRPNRPKKRKEKCKKVKVFRKKIVRLSCPPPKIYVNAPRGPVGPRGPMGPQGAVGPQGPAGSVGTITILPSANRFFYITPIDIQLTNPVSIPASQFTNDDGLPATNFTGNGQYNYSNLFINGILQQSSLYSVSTDALTLQGTVGTIFSGTSIIIEIVSFSVIVTP